MIQDDTQAKHPQPVRLVVWDLDDTFWHGTLSEGGITYRRELHDVVVALARRGIVSSICSKNDPAPVRAVLEREGIWDHFVFPSIDWSAKGPRLAALVDAVQLRAPTILFIDDNPMNLAEAQHYVPGIQVADAACAAGLLDDPRLAGKDDAGLTRLAQYQLLQRRHVEAHAAGDNTAFLRGSGIRVSIEHDITPHLDRAVELINRTNQLNYTKQRLPEDPAEARAALAAQLLDFRLQAGILRVRDRYGDYGYCGLYIVATGASRRRLVQFCFSCRVLDMGVQTWLWRRLGKPLLRTSGEVAAPVDQPGEVDWITLEATDGPAAQDTPRVGLDHVYARGGCDLAAVTHYFGLSEGSVVSELSAARQGTVVLWHHSMFARYAVEGVQPAEMEAFRMLGYQDESFDSYLARLARGQAQTFYARPGHAQPGHAGARSLWVLSFWSDLSARLYRHRATGAMLPLAVAGGLVPPQRPAGARDVPGDQALLARIAEEFEFVGATPEADYRRNLRLLLQLAPRGTQVFILLAQEARPGRDGIVSVQPRNRTFNEWTRQVAGDFANVTTLPMEEFLTSQDDLLEGTHYDRMVYYRIYERIMRGVEAVAA